MSDYPVSPAEAPDTVPENRPDTIDTPEGDNEYAPNQVLPTSANLPELERPRGNEPHPREPIRPAEGV